LDAVAHRLLVDELVQAGYPVASNEQESVFEEAWLPEEEPARFLIGGTITHVEFNTYETWVKSETEDRRTIRWEVLDRDTNRVIATQATTGEAQIPGMDNPAATYEAIRASFRKFLASEPLQQQLAQASRHTTLANTQSYAVTALLPPSDRLSVEQIASRSIPSIVRIRTPEGRGSGFFIDSSGLIVTNQHVVGSAVTVKVDLYDGSTHTGHVLKRDAFTDVALVKTSGEELDIAGLPLCPTTNITVGQEVVAIGNPLSFANTVTKGIISGVRTLQHRPLLQTDVAINPGNSGGPLLNRQGAVVGIVTEKVASRGIEGLGFALPIQESLQTLGVQVQTPELGSTMGCDRSNHSNA
jgi:S1-C subfamily serine protease